jgi:hypothetical protein
MCMLCYDDVISRVSMCQYTDIFCSSLGDSAVFFFFFFFFDPGSVTSQFSVHANTEAVIMELPRILVRGLFEQETVQTHTFTKFCAHFDENRRLHIRECARKHVDNAPMKVHCPRVCAFLEQETVHTHIHKNSN